MRIRFLSLLLAVSLGGSGVAAASELIIFSGRSDRFVKPVVEAFSQQTGIKVVLHSGSSTALLNKLKLEGERASADIYISNDAGNLQKGTDLALFKPAKQAVAERIPANYRAEDNSWLGLSARARVLVVNTGQHETDFVQSVFDLADPRLAGKLGITHSSNESYIAGVTVYMLKAGNDKTRAWLAGMKQNVDGKVFNKHSKIVKAVAAGKKSIGLVNHYYIYRYLDKHPDAPVAIRIPDQGKEGMGVAWNVAGAAISRYTKQEEAAERFMDFVTSAKGQALFASANREYPTRPGVPAAPEIPAVGSFKVADVPMADLGKYRDQTLDLIESVGMP
ncbi:MAG: extracellular solute-binding protein [Proteobacteria bacterium]|jgi:iron(III) transport system substrate-binding protein|nr:extracellular solute-binding protein [Pseudomonadota bacterium]